MSAPDDALAKIGDVADAAGLRRLHVLAWRDLDDVEAGGSEVHADQIARRWAEAGIDVVMRTSRAHGQVSDDRRHGYRVVRKAGRHMVFLDAPFQELIGRMGRRDGLLEVWNGLPFFSPLWARGPRATFIHHVHADMWAQVMSPGLARLGRTLEANVAPRLYQRTRILTPSESSRTQITERLGVPGRNITAVANGVDPMFCPGGTRAAVPTLVAVGRLVAHKRVDQLIRSVARVRQSVPGLELQVVGDGYERPHLERLVNEWGAAEWVHLRGRLPASDVVHLYRQAWATVSMSSAEGWNMSLTEAAACGTPAVATRIPGHVDSVLDEETGLLATTVDNWEEALRRLLLDADLRERLGRSARDRAEALTWDSTALEVLRAIAAPPLR